MTTSTAVTVSWSCPTCRRPTTVTADSQVDADIALSAVRSHHQTGHRAAARSRTGLLPTPAPHTSPIPRINARGDRC